MRSLAYIQDRAAHVEPKLSKEMMISSWMLELPGTQDDPTSDESQNETVSSHASQLGVPTAGPQNTSRLPPDPPAIVNRPAADAPDMANPGLEVSDTLDHELEQLMWEIDFHLAVYNYATCADEFAAKAKEAAQALATNQVQSSVRHVGREMTSFLASKSRVPRGGADLYDDGPDSCTETGCDCWQFLVPHPVKGWTSPGMYLR